MSNWGGRKVAKLTELVMSEYGSLCHLCMKDIATAEEFSVDHVTPRSKGGDDSIENLRPAHRECNFSRGDKSIEAYRATRTDATSWFYGLSA